MATHSSVLAWRIPGTGEHGGLPSGVAQSQTRLKRLSSSSLIENTLSQAWKAAWQRGKRVIYSEELAHAIMVAEKAHNLQSANWRPRKARGII